MPPEKNVDDVRDGIALMVSGERVPAKVQEYAATSMNLFTKDEIYSAMIQKETQLQSRRAAQ